MSGRGDRARRPWHHLAGAGGRLGRQAGCLAWATGKMVMTGQSWEKGKAKEAGGSWGGEQSKDLALGHSSLGQDIPMETLISRH